MSDVDVVYDGCDCVDDDCYEWGWNDFEFVWNEWFLKDDCC